MTRIEELTAVYTSLQSLLKEAATRAVDENAFQRWFEAHPVVFEVLGYQRWIPKPRLMLGDGKALEPDFLVQDFAGVWTIFEIKRADTVVLKNPDRRTDFRSEYSTYVEQCCEYSDFFLDAANRAQVKQSYQIDIQQRVPAVLVASVDANTDCSVVREKLVGRGNRVTAQTYTAVAETVGRELDRTTSESLPGLSVCMLLALPESNKRQVFLDFGLALNKNRLTIGLDNGYFIFTLHDADGQKQTERVRRPVIVDFANASGLTMVEVEVGARGDRLHFSAFINRRSVVSKEIVGSTIQSSELLEQSVLGSDLTETVHANFGITDLVIYPRTLTWRERAQLRQHLHERYRYYLSPLARGAPTMIAFIGLKYFTSKNSPDRPLRDPANRGPWARYNTSSLIKDSSGRLLDTADPMLGEPTVTLPGDTLSAQLPPPAGGTIALAKP